MVLLPMGVPGDALAKPPGFRGKVAIPHSSAKFTSHLGLTPGVASSEQYVTGSSKDLYGASRSKKRGCST